MLAEKQYYDFWKLKEKPFEEVRNPRFFFESSEHIEALHRLSYVIREKGLFGLLTGEIGSGKTTTRMMLENRFSRREYEIISVDNANLGFNDIVFDIINNIKFTHIPFETDKSLLFEKRSDKYFLLTILKEHLEHLYNIEKRHLVVVLDEAQQFAADSLDEIKNLTNIHIQERNVITVLLLGETDLLQKVQSIEQLDQRISTRFHLNNLNMEDTKRYIEHRLRVAGYQGNGLFSDQAYQKIYTYSKGSPRVINRLGKFALEYIHAGDEPMIQGDVVDLIQNNIVI